MNQYFNLIKRYKLDYYFSILLKHNKANSAPYHNLYHTLNVMDFSNEILKDIKIEEEITKEQIRLMLIASLFHDFNHSQGKLSDDKNVQEAIDMFNKYSIESDVDNEFIINVIKATQYPYVIEDEQLTIFQKVIRDADLLQMFNDNFIQQNIIGLSTEFNSDIETSVVNSIKFFKGIKYHTDFAKKMNEEYMIDNIEDLEYMLECFNISPDE